MFSSTDRTMNTQETASARKRRFWERIIVCAAFSSILTLGFLKGWFVRFRADVPFFDRILFFVFINLNFLLLLLLVYLVLRNIVKLIFERKRNILGSKLKTRLVVASVALTLIPAIPLFWLASQFIFSSLDHWFSSKVEQSLEHSVLLAREFVEHEHIDLMEECARLMPEIAAVSRQVEDPGESDVRRRLARGKVDALFVYDPAGGVKWSMTLEDAATIDPMQLRSSVQKEGGRAYRLVKIPGGQDVIAASLSFPGAEEGGEPEGLIAVRLLPAQFTRKLESITGGYEHYLQLKMMHRPLKKSHFITFSIVTMLAIFAAVWFGFFLAKNLTGPIQKLLSATQHIADGDLEVRLEPDRQDEIGMLMVSFNSMIGDLRESREKLDRAYNALQSTNIELEDRRRYMEIVLRNIAAGVVSVDCDGNITTMNKSAEVIFETRAEEARGKHYTTFLDESRMEIVRSFMDSYKDGQAYIEQPAQIKAAGSPMSLLIKVSVLRDDQGKYMGVVVVLDDFTELEKAQRMAAWREVARRIAHEIKNPLTPIQLSAQRLRRKYSELLVEEGSIFDQCTRTIVQQVEHMKLLVNEFSRFARLPRAKLAPCRLSEIVEEGLSLYRHNFSRIVFALEPGEGMPLLRLDRDQFRQVVINLLENAVHAIGEDGGEITIRLSYDPDLKIARMECADTGHGIAPEHRLRVFEPYYSTKEKGTGLGLAIVSSIVADHNGFIRVRSNEPRGAIIIVELPG